MENPNLEVELAIKSAAKAIGVDELKPKQMSAVFSFVNGSDVFVALPTGYGKSICFAILPLVFNALRGNPGSIVVCVSPLTALMMEQRAKFSIRGLVTEFIGELQQDVEAMANVKKGTVQLLYVSPESILSNPQWRDMILLPVYQKNLVALVVKLTVLLCGKHITLGRCILQCCNSALLSTGVMTSGQITGALGSCKLCFYHLFMSWP